MKARVRILMYLLLTSMMIQANDTIPIQEGLWEVVQVTVEKNTDGTVEKNVYDKAEEVKSNIRCPRVWVIIHVPQAILLHYADKSENLYFYDFDDKNLIMILDDDGLKQSYKYELKGEELILTTVFKPSERNKEQNIEQWTVILKRAQIQYLIYED